MLWLAPLVALVVIITLAVIAWRLRKRRRRAKLHGPVALLGPLIAPATRPLPRPTLTRGMPVITSQHATPPYRPATQPTYAPPPPPPEPFIEPLPNAPGGNGHGEGEASDGDTKRHVRADRTLQFLPGRLEVIAGKGLGNEIRFVRTGGPDGSSVTFGRSNGPPYRHVQLDVPTVSRRHARMRWDGSHWVLTNLSATNPVAINGVALPGEGTAIDLSDGDRVEMGEVAFRFHAQ